MKRTLHTCAALLLSLLPFLSASQEIGCAAKGSETFNAILTQQLPQLQRLEAEFLVKQRLRSGQVVKLPVQFHVIRSTSGSTTLSQSTLDQAVANMNAYYVNAGLEFFQCSGPKYVDNTNLSEFDFDDENVLLAASYVKSVINIYCVNSIEGGYVAGYTYLPQTVDGDFILIDNEVVAGPTLPHEMGHYFGLLHTHGPDNCTSALPGTDELVNGSNCSSAGDRICDTPADPGLLGPSCSGYLVDGACIYRSDAVDANGQRFQPDIRNIMSYSRAICRDRLSAGQYARINAVYNQFRKYLACGQDPGNPGPGNPPVVTVAKLSMAEAITLTPNPVQPDKTFSLKTNVYNSGNKAFTGKVRVSVFTAQGQFLDHIGTAAITQPLLPGIALTTGLTLSNANLTLQPGVYQAVVFFQPDSSNTFTQAGSERFPSSLTFTVPEPPIVCDPPANISLARSGYSNLAFSWDALNGAMYYQIQIREKGQTTWSEVPNWQSTMITYANRKPCTTYEWRIRTVCAQQTSAWSDILTATTEGCGETYCYSYGSSFRSFIQEVTIGNVNLNSGNDFGYANFTEDEVQADQGQSLTVSLKPGTRPGELPRMVFWRIWADLNQDKDFTDPGELLLDVTTGNTETILKNIQIPANALSGATRLRISLAPASAPNPCDRDGERDVEDYTLVVGQPAFLTINPDSLGFGPEGGTQAVEVNSNAAWTVTSLPSWVQVSPAAGQGPGVVMVTVNPNNGQIGRFTQIEFRTGNIIRNLKIIQQFAEYPLNWGFKVTGRSHLIVIRPNLVSDVEGQALGSGDLIGAFYQDNGQERCAGFVRWTGKDTALPVYGDDPFTTDKEGFTGNELFRFRVFLTALRKDVAVESAFAPVDGLGLMTHTDRFAQNGISQLVRLFKTKVHTQVIALQKGPNLVSSYLKPNEPAMESVFAGINNAVERVMDEEERMMIPSQGINEIGSWQFRKGYEVHNTAAANLTITGQQVKPSETPIPIAFGWQIIPFYGKSPKKIQEALASILDKVVMVKDYAGRIYLPDWDFNLIGQLQPGQAYWLRAWDSDTLFYPDDYVADPAEILPMSEDLLEILPDHFSRNALVNTGINATIVFPVEVLEGIMQTGDEIGVFTAAGRLCGAARFSGHHLAINIWGDDPYTEQEEGLRADEPYLLKIWRPDYGEINLRVAYQEGDGLFSRRDLEVVKRIEPARAFDRFPVSEFSVMPNPARERLTLAIGEAVTGAATIRLAGMDGRVWRTWAFPQGLSAGMRQELMLGDLPAGVYQLQVLSNAFRLNRKIAVVR